MEDIYLSFSLVILIFVGLLVGGYALALTIRIWLPLREQISQKRWRGYHMDSLQVDLSAVLFSPLGSIILSLLNCCFYITGKHSSSDILLANGIFLGVSTGINLIGISIGIWLENYNVKSLLKIQTLLENFLCFLWLSLYMASYIKKEFFSPVVLEKTANITDRPIEKIDLEVSSG